MVDEKYARVNTPKRYRKWSTKFLTKLRINICSIRNPILDWQWINTQKSKSSHLRAETRTPKGSRPNPNKTKNPKPIQTAVAATGAKRCHCSWPTGPTTANTRMPKPQQGRRRKERRHCHPVKNEQPTNLHRQKSLNGSDFSCGIRSGLRVSVDAKTVRPPSVTVAFSNFEQARVA